MWCDRNPQLAMSRSWAGNAPREDTEASTPPLGLRSVSLCVDTPAFARSDLTQIQRCARRRRLAGNPGVKPPRRLGQLR